MQRILITGAGGQLGRCLAEAAAQWPDSELHAYSRSELDLSDEVALHEIFSSFQPTHCFNCAAYTAVDKAEEELELAMRINRYAVASLGAVCKLYATRLVHFSTDYVYADYYNRPLREDDTTQGLGVYAASKLQGEQALMGQYATAIIIRTSWVYSEYGHNFAKTMLRLGRERDRLQVVCDQIGTPTYARDLAAAAIALVQHPSVARGVYNYSNSGACSWYDFAMAVHRLGAVNCSVLPVRSSAYPTAARRPFYSVLDKEKIATLIDMPRHWEAALADCMQALLDSTHL